MSGIRRGDYVTTRRVLGSAAEDPQRGAFAARLADSRQRAGCRSRTKQCVEPYPWQPFFEVDKTLRQGLCGPLFCSRSASSKACCCARTSIRSTIFTVVSALNTTSPCGA